MNYQPIRKKFKSASEETNKLLKQKRILEFSASTAGEWLDLAKEFLADGGRANYSYCMMQYKKHGGKDIFCIVEIKEISDPSESELMDWTDH